MTTAAADILALLPNRREAPSPRPSWVPSIRFDRHTAEAVELLQSAPIASSERLSFSAGPRPNQLASRRGEVARQAVFWPARTYEDRLYERRAALKIEAAKIAMHLTESWRRHISNQMDDLLDAESWHEEDPLPTIASFSSFLRFVVYERRLRLPRLLVGATGNFSAAWFDSDRRLTVEFLPKDQVRLVLSRKIEGGAEQSAYQGPFKRLDAVLTPYDALKWYRDEGA